MRSYTLIETFFLPRSGFVQQVAGESTEKRWRVFRVSAPTLNAKRFKQNMPNLSLSEAFRYFFSGLVAFFFLHIYDSSLTVNLLKSYGPIGISVCMLVLGTIFYLLYRPLIYDSFIIWIHDRLRFKTDNYRTYFKKKYGISSIQALQLYKHVRNNHLNEKLISFKTEASGIHFLYIIGLLAIPFIILNLVNSESDTLYFFISISIIFNFAAFIWDRRFENMELGFIKEIDQSIIDGISEKLFNK